MDLFAESLWNENLTQRKTKGKRKRKNSLPKTGYTTILGPDGYPKAVKILKLSKLYFLHLNFFK